MPPGMKLLKSLITRLSDSFFASVPERLRISARLRPAPSLRLVAHNPTPAAEHVRRYSGPMGQSEAIDEAVRRSKAWLLSRQHPLEGYWVAELEADSTLTSEYLMLRRFLDRVDSEREE